MPEDKQVLHDKLEKMVTQELTAKAMDDVSRQAFIEEKRRIASQKKASQTTRNNQLRAKCLVKQLPEGIFISQDKYVADILKKFDFLSIRTATTPIESNKPMVKDVDVHVYREYTNLSDAEIYAGLATLGCGASLRSKLKAQPNQLKPQSHTAVTKTTYGKAALTLVKRVKILEKALKRKTQRVVISESEGKEPED
ncbi:hypothetical protein Tco_0597078 [Tanacetum coccineum]